MRIRDRFFFVVPFFRIFGAFKAESFGQDRRDQTLYDLDTFFELWSFFL